MRSSLPSGGASTAAPSELRCRFGSGAPSGSAVASVVVVIAAAAAAGAASRPPGASGMAASATEDEPPPAAAAAPFFFFRTMTVTPSAVFVARAFTASASHSPAALRRASSAFTRVFVTSRSASRRARSHSPSSFL